jgi:hypothetical protein
MRAYIALAALSVAGMSLSALSAPAAAQALVNARGSAAKALPGKTCQGVFDSGRKHQWSDGAAEIVFTVEGDQLTAQYSQQLGAEAHDPAEYAMVKNQPINSASYQHLGPVQDLTVRGSNVRFTDASGVRFALKYRRGGLNGQRDPRASSADPRMTRINFVRMRCR